MHRGIFFEAGRSRSSHLRAEKNAVHDFSLLHELFAVMGKPQEMERTAGLFETQGVT